MAQSEFVGVDACTDGWVSVGLSAGRPPELEKFASFGDLLGRHAAARLILVDMPIGLPTGQKNAQIGPKPRNLGGRRCDWEAKGLLYEHQNRVFLTPTRSTVKSSGKYDDKYKKAKKVEHDASGASLTRQSFGLIEKIHQIDNLLPLRGDTPKV